MRHSRPKLLLKSLKLLTSRASLGSATARRVTSALIRAGGATGSAAFAGRPMSAFGQETTKYGFGPERYVRFRPKADIATLYSIWLIRPRGVLIHSSHREAGLIS
jgi:hypothetical protein